MGTLGDNLLKLTEFPFSYSLISLLAFISFGESFLSLPIEKLGPLLILMGFVATTLSITDPIGALQKLFLKGFHGSNKLFGKDQPSDVVGRLAVILSAESYYYDQRFVADMKTKTLGTTWIVREIDKITAMIYFIAVVLVLIVAELVLQSFTGELLIGFQDIPLAGYLVLGFSFAALVSVSAMAIIRLRHLNDKARKVYRFLTLMDATNTMSRSEAYRRNKESIDKGVEQIERYFNEGNWTLADLLTVRIYNELEEKKKNQQH